MPKADPELEHFIRQIVKEQLFDYHDLGRLRVFGSWSQKKLGEELSAALMHNPIVVIDGRGITRISGHKPGWR